MTLEHDESLEDYEERFHLSYRRPKCTFDPKSLKLVLLRGDIYQVPYEYINIVFKNHSRETRKKGRGSQPMAISSSSNTSIKGEIRNMLEYLKSEMLQTLALQMDIMHIKRKQEEVERELAIFFPKCTRRHPRNQCPLNLIDIGSVCEENHSTYK